MTRFWLIIPLTIRNTLANLYLSANTEEYSGIPMATQVGDMVQPPKHLKNL